MKMPFGLRRPRLTIGEGMGAIAMIAIACAWPPLLVPTAAGLLGLVLHRLGFSLLQLLVFMGGLGFALGLLLPSISSH